MLDWITKQATPGFLGCLVGIILVIWVEPTTTPGIGLIIFVSVLTVIIIHACTKALIKIFKKRVFDKDK